MRRFDETGPCLKIAGGWFCRRQHHGQVPVIIKKEHLENYLRQFPGAKPGFPFGPEALVLKVMGKMFALVSLPEEPPRVTLKCHPTDAPNLVRQYDVFPDMY